MAVKGMIADPVYPYETTMDSPPTGGLKGRPPTPGPPNPLPPASPSESEDPPYQPTTPSEARDPSMSPGKDIAIEIAPTPMAPLPVPPHLDYVAGASYGPHHQPQPFNTKQSQQWLLVQHLSTTDDTRRPQCPHYPGPNHKCFYCRFIVNCTGNPRVFLGVPRPGSAGNPDPPAGYG
jgi:hypothetical protein